MELIYTTHGAILKEDYDKWKQEGSTVFNLGEEITKDDYELRNKLRDEQYQQDQINTNQPLWRISQLNDDGTETVIGYSGGNQPNGKQTIRPSN